MAFICAWSAPYPWRTGAIVAMLVRVNPLAEVVHVPGEILTIGEKVVGVLDLGRLLELRLLQGSLLALVLRLSHVRSLASNSRAV